jgi:tRNA G10  N-methylase Trm11
VGGEVEYTGEAELEAACRAALLQRSNEDEIRAHVHGFHAYPARLHPKTASELVTRLSAPGQTVLDPFCGSGTVLVEALSAGRQALGTDLNPLAVLLAQAKCKGLSPYQQDELLHTATGIKELADERRRDKAGPTHKYEPEERALFDVHVLLELDSLHAGIGKLEKGPIQSHLQLILSSILVKLSRQTSDTDEREAPRRIAGGYAARMFLKRTEEWLRQVREFEALAPHPRPKFAAYVTDARQLKPLRNGTVDLVVTSPPYPGVYDYYAHHAMRLRWLQLRGADFQRLEMGSRRQLSESEDPQAIWRDDLASVMRQLERVMKKGALACFVIADSAIGRVLLRADVETQRAITDSSLTLVAHARQTRPLFHRATEDAYRRSPRYEHLLVLRRS